MTRQPNHIELGDAIDRVVEHLNDLDDEAERARFFFRLASAVLPSRYEVVESSEHLRVVRLLVHEGPRKHVLTTLANSFVQPGHARNIGNMSSTIAELARYTTKGDEDGQESLGDSSG